MEKLVEPPRIVKTPKDELRSFRENETVSQYMGRIIRYFGETPDSFLDEQFLTLILKHKKIFKKVIKALPSLQINGACLSFFQKTMESREPELIAKLAKRMMQTNELKLTNARWAYKTLKRCDEVKYNKTILKLETYLVSKAAELEARRLSTALDQNGFCFAMIEAVARQDYKIFRLLIDKLEKQKSPFPLIEIVVGSIFAKHASAINFRTSLMSPAEVSAILKTPTPLNPTREFYVRCLLKNTEELGEDIFEVKELTILPGQNFFDIALDSHLSDLCQTLTRLIEFSQDPDLAVFLNKAKQHPFYRFWSTGESLKQLDGVCLKPKGHIVHSEKTGHKTLVARHDRSTKAQRQEMKAQVKDLIDAMVDLAKNPNSELYEGLTAQCLRVSNEVLRIQFTIYQDKYEIIEGTIPGQIREHCLVIKNDRESALIGKWSLPINISLLAKVLKGNKLETITTAVNDSKRVESRHKDDRFWDTWTSSCLNPHAPWKTYKDHIHPYFVSVVSHLIHSQQISQPVLLEVCGGTGQMAAAMLQKVDQIAAYTLLEFNRPSVNMARNLLCKTVVTVVQTDVVSEQFYKDEYKTEIIQPECIDVAFGSGALTAEVLKNKDAALSVLKKMYISLKPQGYVILFGLARPLVDSQDLIQMGFNVINTHAPSFAGMNFYIGQKR